MFRLLLKFTALLLGLCVSTTFCSLHAGEPQADSQQKKTQWQAMLTPARHTAPSVPVSLLRPKRVATLFGEPVMSDDPQTVFGKIFGSLLKEYAKERGVTVSDAEVALYAEGLKERDRHWIKQQAVYIEELKEALASGTLSQEESRLARRRIEAAEFRADPRNQLSPEEDRRIWEQVVRPILQNYKIYQQLYRDYGGRVVFQQMGPEPLDAMRMLLEAEQAKGSFVLLDPEAEADFWKYFTTTPHFYINDEAEIQRLMNTPWWLEPLPE